MTWLWSSTRRWGRHWVPRYWECPGLGRWSPGERASGPWHPSLSGFWRSPSSCSFEAEWLTDRGTVQRISGLAESWDLDHKQRAKDCCMQLFALFDIQVQSSHRLQHLDIRETLDPQLLGWIWSYVRPRKDLFLYFMLQENLGSFVLKPAEGGGGTYLLL